MITRELEKIIVDGLYKGKAIIILGPRQVGKSTLIQELKSKLGKKTLVLNCDMSDVKKQLSDPSLTELQRIIKDHDLVMIDEAQRVMDIGLTLKLIIDNFPQVQLIVTGSSSLDLSNQVNEPLTGRKFEYRLFPLSTNELVDHFGFLETKRDIEHRLVFGNYPDVINNPGNEPEILSNLAGSYLFKDVFMYQDIRKPEFIEQLIEALALQMASEVSFNELAQLLKTDPHTVQRYISLLEKAFIIFRLRSYSRNTRNELKKSRKIYFYDNGIRNALIGNYNPLSSRTDAGALWENFCISERMKYLQYNKIYAKSYFWRTTQQQEIDYLEETGGKIHAYEIKWNPTRAVSFPLTFTRNYPDAGTSVINLENFWDFAGVE